jgi:phage shock protein PspC (stress-responsive transcriptional regulator)
LHNDVEGVEIWVLGGVVGTFVIIIVAYLILTYITRDDNEGNTLK